MAITFMKVPEPECEPWGLLSWVYPVGLTSIGGLCYLSI